MSTHSERRVALREEIFGSEAALESPEKGWFKASRALPHVLGLLASKKVSGEVDATRVYLELLARHIDSGFVELGSEADHAFASGYSGDRAIRTWRERMKTLEKTGFIKTKPSGTQPYKYVLLVPTEVVIDKLKRAGKVSTDWTAAYHARRLETGEITPPAKPKPESDKPKRIRRGNVIPSG